MFDNPATRKLIGIVIIIAILPVLLSLLGNWLPTELPEEVGGAISYFINELFKWDFILPVDALLQITLLTLYLQIGFFSINIALMIWNWIKETG